MSTSDLWQLPGEPQIAQWANELFKGTPHELSSVGDESGLSAAPTQLPVMAPPAVIASPPSAPALPSASHVQGLGLPPVQGLPVLYGAPAPLGVPTPNIVPSIPGLPAVTGLPGVGSMGSTPSFSSLPSFGLPIPAVTTPELPSAAHALEHVGPAHAWPNAQSLPNQTWPTEQAIAPAVLALEPAVGTGAPVLGAPAFSVDRVRRDFPILQERVNGKPLIWLDNAATTQKPLAVIERLAYFYAHENSNVHRAAHTLAGRATDAYEGARSTVQRFLGAPTAEGIVFVRGATEAINLVAQSWGARNIERGDEIVLTVLEHHSNIVPWQLLCAQTGAQLKVAPVDSSGQIILEAYERLFTRRTKLAAITHVSNALGTITPVREMTEIAHRHGARVLVDGAQAVSHFRVNVQALDCDFYVLSGHKLFAPTGIGALYGKPEVLSEMPPWQGGGNMIADVTFEKTVYNPPPSRFEAGTGNIADAVGLGAAIDYLESIGFESAALHEHTLLEYAQERLRGVPRLRPVGTAREKAGVLSFVLDGIPTEQVGQALAAEGIAVRAGHHCAQPALRRFGLEATVRPSLAFYNTQADIDALVAVLSDLVVR